MAETDIFLELTKFRTSIENLTKEVKEVNKLYKNLDNKLDLVYKDRDLFTELFEKIGGLKEFMVDFYRHNDVVTQEVKSEVQETAQKVEKKTEEVKDVVEEHVGNLAEDISNKKVIVKKEKKGIFG